MDLFEIKLIKLLIIDANDPLSISLEINKAYHSPFVCQQCWFVQVVPTWQSHVQVAWKLAWPCFHGLPMGLLFIKTTFFCCLVLQIWPNNPLPSSPNFGHELRGGLLGAIFHLTLSKFVNIDNNTIYQY